MSELQRTTDNRSISERVDAVADRFEAAWKGDALPAIGNFLDGWEGEARLRLLRELVQLDGAYRERRGLPRADAEHARAWPELRESSAAPSAPPLPERIGRYRVDAVLGSGSFGTVYRAYDERMQRAVALKVLREDAAMPGDAATAFLSEARVVAQLHHPHAVTVHDAGEADGCKYIVYELIDGESLHARLQRGPLSAAEAAGLLAPIAEVLHHAHTHGLLHRDVKPANILVDAAGRALLIDFGLGIREQDLAPEVGRLVGSYAYLPPEMVRGEGHRLDGRGDIYSLGVVLYESICGRRPFRAVTRAALFDEILHQEPKPPRQVNDAIRAGLERVCLKAMAKRISERYTTALDLAADLRACAVEDPGVRGEHRGPKIEDRRSKIEDRGEEVGSRTSVVSRQSSMIRPATPIVPRGLRPFGGADADFFLDLLPGPRERDGLPESVHFWKSRIIEGAGDGERFRVGLVCGPSGCGKSSLVRAGLLPRLGDAVVSVYAEAEREATETRLRERLQRACPDLNAALDLPGAVAALRRGECPGRKVLIVIDQLEQWLQACGADLADRPLVAALRQADGERVQFILLVRDDYWLGAARLFRELELPLREGENLRVVDLFDSKHARRVLRALGEAHGALEDPLTPNPSPPRGEGSRSPSPPRGEGSGETSAFLDEAVRQLGEDGKVVPVRLSLFAELMKSRPWTRRGLREVGGIEGLGVTFLEETFASRSAHPEHRRQAPAARAVLAALLPDAGDVIRGRGRRRDELLTASGLADDAAGFEKLLETLDRDLRLITPVEGEGDAPAGHQLAHDYLVPAVRQWLRQHEQTTWRGRARLRLAERAAQWARHPEPRFLPSVPEYVSMVAGVPRGRRQPAEQAMLRSASRHLGARFAVLALAAALLGWGAWEAHGQIRSRGVVEAIESATLAEADRIVTDELPRYRRWADDRLHKHAISPDATRERRLRASLAYLPERVDFLADCLLDGSLVEIDVIRGRLVPFAALVTPRLTEVLNDGNRPAALRFRAALALALLQPDGPWPRVHAGFLARQLVQASPDEQASLRALLRPVGRDLIDGLRPLLSGAGSARAAARALADFAADQPGLLAELAAEATPEQFAEFYPALASSGDRAEVLSALEALARDTHQNVEGGRRRAGAIVSLFRLGARTLALDRLAASDDTETRAQLAQRVHDGGIEPETLAECLEEEAGFALRQDLILALGEFSHDELPPALRDRLAQRLSDWHRNDDRAGVHAGCSWLLRRWGLRAAVAEAEQTPVFPPPPGRGWLVRRVGSVCLTFAIQPRVCVKLGSPENEMFHVRDEVLRDVMIEEPVAVADREVTVGLWNEFLRSRALPPLADAAELPARDLSWYEAVAFCRWLTEQAGMTEADQCYRLPAQAERTGDGLVKNWEFDPERHGFRLPTDAEWEAACRAGTRDAYSFGNDPALLDRHGWFLGPAERRPQPVATKRPNRLGLFDMHGNVWEWCQDEYEAPKAGERAGTRVYRGGSFDNYPRHGRSACRINDQPGFHFPFVGLRVVFTLPDADRAVRLP